MQFYFVVLKMLGLKDPDSNIIIIQTGQWYGVNETVKQKYTSIIIR